MKRIWLLVVLVLSGLVVQAQEEVLTLDDVMDSAEQWAQENLDENVLRALQSADQEKVKKLFADFQKQFQGEYIVDLAALRDTAKEVLPLLEASPETRPYAVWLKTRMDYLDVAEQFRLTIPPPKSEPGQPPKPVPNPSPQAEREIWIKKVTERPWPKNAKAYVETLKPVFSAQRVPPELVWIAEVESSFDPQACSPVGAAGLFQLMPATAKRFGLKTWPMDQRLKPEPSGRAAAQYLQYLYSRFKDWRLALAAYNAGEGTVQRLLQQRQARTFDAIATRLPAETQMYVPKIEAVLLRREGLTLSQLRVPTGRS